MKEAGDALQTKKNVIKREDSKADRQHNDEGERERTRGIASLNHRSYLAEQEIAEGNKRAHAISRLNRTLSNPLPTEHLMRIGALATQKLGT